MTARRVRWLIGLAGVGAVAAAFFYLPLSSVLGWESSFPGRVFFCLLFSAFLCLVRVVMGPTALDRAVAVDGLGILIVGFCAVFCLATGRSWYLDIGIAWALQSFIGTLALAKYSEGKTFDA